jgi:ABC-type multidrug transport system fused ATPase/permease subunit
MNYERFFQILKFISIKDRVTLVILTAFQIVLGLLDLVGVALIGGISILSVGGNQSNSIMKLTDTPLNYFGASEATIARKILILGVIAGFLLTIKTVASIFLVRLTFKFLAVRTTNLTRVLTSRVMHLSEIDRRNFKNQELAYALTQGTERAVLGILGVGVAVVSDIFLTFILIVGSVLVSPFLALSTMIFFFSIGLITHKITRNKSARISSQLIDLNTIASRLVIESNMNIRDLIVRGRRNAFIERIVFNRSEASTQAAELAFLPYIGKYIIESSVVIGALLLMVSQFLYLEPITALGVIAFFIAAASRIAPAVLRVQQGFLQISISEGLTKDVFEILKLEAYEYSSFPKGKDLKQSDSGEIEIIDLQFSYPSQDSFALDIPHLKIAGGSYTAIVGESGSGKSTLIDLCLGILKASKGEVRIAGFPAGAFIENFPGHVGYVPQNVVLIDGTVKENILLGFPESEFPKEKLEEALYLSVLDDFVNQLSIGIDSPISEWGGNLSGGQRQRIGIARTLVTGPRIIILDEATSAMDSQTESIFHERMKGYRDRSTIIVVTHKLTTIREADNVVFIKDGAMKTQGDFNSLYSSDNEFKKQMDYMSKSNLAED